MSAVAPAASPARLRLDRIAWALLPAAPFVAVLAVWAAYWQIARPPAATLPSILAVVQVVGDIAGDGRLGANVLASLWRLLLGASLGILTGVVAGFATGLYRGISEFLSPLVIFFNAISGIVWLPLMIGWPGCCFRPRRSSSCLSPGRSIGGSRGRPPRPCHRSSRSCRS